MTAATRPITGRKVLVLLVGFFAVVALVNGIFVWFAEDSFPGLQTEDAYRKGLTYNEQEDPLARLHRLGWQAEIGWQDSGPGRGRLAVRLATGDGRAISGLDVRAVLRRPVNDRSDQTLRLPEIGPGVYAADVSLAGGGNWDTELHVTRQGREMVILRRRLLVR